MRSRSELSVGQVVPSRGCERRWGRGSRAGAGFSPQPQAGAVVAARQPPAQPRLGGAGSANSPAGRGAGGGGQQKRGPPASSRSRWGAPPGRSLPAAPRWAHAALKEEGSAVKVSAVPAPPNGQRRGTG